VSIIRTLILSRSDVNATTISGETPIMKAIAFYQPKAVKLLLRFGANPFLRNNVTNKTSLQQSIQMNNDEIINLLCKYEDVYKKIALVLLAYMTLGNTERRTKLNTMSIPLIQKLVKYIIP
jgi:ankyrin repeat protein